MEWPAKYKAKTVDTPAFTSICTPRLSPWRSQGRASAIARRHRFGAGDRRDAPNVRPWASAWTHLWARAPNDRIIKALFEAKKRANPTRITRVLENVNEFPTFGAETPSAVTPLGMFGRGSCIGLKENQKITFELYHLINDPMEANDLSAAEPQRTAQMRKALSGGMAAVRLVQLVRGGLSQVDVHKS